MGGLPMKRVQLGTVATLAATCLLAAHAQTNINIPGPDAQRLMLGNWSTRIQYEPSKDMPKGGTATGEEKWYPGPGGNSLIEEYRESGVAGDIAGLGVAWWDSKAKGLHVVWCESTNPSGCSVPSGLAHWENNQLVLTSEDETNGQKTKFKEVFSEITPTSFKQTLSLGEAGSELKLLVTIYATRKSSP